MTASTRERTEVAHEIARRLAAVRDVEGVCLFGSIARGESSSWSDIDLLVVGGDDVRPTTLLRALPERLRRERLSLVCYSKDELRQLFDSGSSFVDHIRHEGRILHDRTGFLEQVLTADFEPRIDVKGELDAELERLRVYDDVSVYNDNFLFGFAQLYAIGKAIVILGLIADGQREFARDPAFAAFRRLYPEVAPAVDTVERLRPFYQLVTRRQPETLPFSYVGTCEEFARAAAAVRALAASIDARQA